MLKRLVNRVVLGELAPEYVAHHYDILPYRFEEIEFPNVCVVCLEPATTDRPLESEEWASVIDHGGFRETRRGVLQTKSVGYCADHAPGPEVDGRHLPGIKLKAKTRNGSVTWIVVELDNPAYRMALDDAYLAMTEREQPEAAAMQAEEP